MIFKDKYKTIIGVIGVHFLLFTSLNQFFFIHTIKFNFHITLKVLVT